MPSGDEMMMPFRGEVSSGDGVISSRDGISSRDDEMCPLGVKCPPGTE